MPIFLAAFLGGLLSAASSFVGRVLIALGISYVTYTGLDTLIDWIIDQIHDEISGAPVVVVQILGLLQVDTCISILASAVAARLVLRGLTGGALTKMVIK